MLVKKIISGGQTGADRGGLDAAIAHGIPIGGFIPCGRWAEDGPISSVYVGLRECDSRNPAERTKLNVAHSDGTLIFTYGKPIGGSELTIRTARQLRTPRLHLDLIKLSEDSAVERIVLWIRTAGVTILNVAGSRESKDPGIYSHTKSILGKVFEALERE
jgi:hypothetical protein